MNMKLCHLYQTDLGHIQMSCFESGTTTSAVTKNQVLAIFMKDSNLIRLSVFFKFSECFYLSCHLNHHIKYWVKILKSKLDIDVISLRNFKEKWYYCRIIFEKEIRQMSAWCFQHILKVNTVWDIYNFWKLSCSSAAKFLWYHAVLKNPHIHTFYVSCQKYWNSNVINWLQFSK